MAEGGFSHVELFEASWDDVALLERVDRHGGADVVFAGRVLHHAARPAAAVRAFARLLRPGGHLVVVDYLPHADERMRTEQADVWLGFAEADLSGFMREAGLNVTPAQPLPAAWRGQGPDAHLPWQTMVGQRPCANA